MRSLGEARPCTTHVLLSAGLVVIIDSSHGGEILSLVDRSTGGELLGRPPFAPARPLPGDLDEQTWTAAYRGGWQCAAPNAGEPSSPHGFHGAASVDPWEVVDAREDALVLSWRGHGLQGQRSYAVAGRELRIAADWRSAGDPAPMVAVEHVTVGLNVLDPEVRIVLPGGLALELDTGVPDLGRAIPWPDIALLDGTRERGDIWPLERNRARYHVVTALPEGRAAAINARSGVGLELEWDVGRLPHLWIWHEMRGSGGPWRGHAEILGIEPASVPHGAGLGAARSSGHALWPSAAEPFSYEIVARPVGS